MNLIGQRFGYLVALESWRYNGIIKWVCRCDCGRLTFATKTYLVRGRKRSCGCKKKELFAESKKTHGMCRTVEYKIWKGIIKRCENPNSKDFSDYKQRGVCTEWRADFMQFFGHVGPRPSPEHSIDRIDNNRGYEPGNVKWSTAKEQANNRRQRRWYKKPEVA